MKTTEVNQRKTKSVPRPYLMKRKRSKNWYVVYADVKTGKLVYRTTGTDDREGAEAVLREILTSQGFSSKASLESEHLKRVILDSVERTTGVVIQHKTPLEEIWKEYERNERVRALKAYTRRNNKIILEAFLRFIQGIGIQYVEQVNYEACKAYIDSLRAEDKSDGTITNHRHCLHGIFRRVKRPLGLQVNPFEDVETPFRPKRKKHRCFTPEELKKVLGAVSEDWRVLITLSFYTGLRFADCCMFKMDCIDWDKDLIVIKPGKTERYNKELIIPIHPTLKTALKSYSRALSGYLIPHFAKLQEARDFYFSRRFGEIIKSLEIPKETEEGILDFHSLRHTFNTNLANGGIDTSTRMKLAGHSSVEVNQIYNHATEPLRGAISCLPQI